MVSGSAPSRAEPAQRSIRNTGKGTRSPSHNQANDPADTGARIRRCLSKSPVDRWQSAADLKCELEWIVESGTVPAWLPVPAIRRTKALSLYAGLATMSHSR